MAEPSFRSELGVVRHNPLVVGAAASPLVAAGGIALASLVTMTPWAVLIPFLLFGGLFLLGQALLHKPMPKVVFAQVEATRDGITVGGRTHARGAFRSGFVVRDDKGRCFVRLQPKRVLAPWLELIVADEREGERLLQALGLDALHSVARMHVASVVLARPGLQILAVVGLVLAGFLLASALDSALPALLGFLAVLVANAWPSTIDVGADGVNVTWLWHRRFVPAASIVNVSIYEQRLGKQTVRGLELWLEGGERYRIAVSSPTWDAGRTAMLASRVATVAHARRAGIPLGSELALLERGSADARSWLDRLRALGSGANATHRVAPVRPESLWRAVEDPNAEPRVRVAAAAALAGSAEGADRVRLADVAGATADPRLRVALEAAASGDDDALARSLDELSPDVPDEARRSA